MWGGEQKQESKKIPYANQLSIHPSNPWAPGICLCVPSWVKYFLSASSRPGAVAGPGEAPAMTKGPEKTVPVDMSVLGRGDLSVSSSNFANKALNYKPSFLHLKTGIRAKQLTFGSTDFNQVDHILMF